MNQLVSIDQYVPENPSHVALIENGHEASSMSNSLLIFHQPTAYSPYPDYSSHRYKSEFPQVRECFLDADEHSSSPSVYAYSGIPQGSSLPSFGSYEELGLNGNVCFDRYGRYGPYGLGYSTDRGGAGVGLMGDRAGIEAVWAKEGKIDWRRVDIGAAQRRCYEKNKGRFGSEPPRDLESKLPVLAPTRPSAVGPADSRSKECNISEPSASEPGRKCLARTAVVLRTWGDFDYAIEAKMYIRALVNELSLGSGGEYDVHLLVQIKDVSKPIWTSNEVYQQVLNDTVPEEFRSIATLWSERQMELLYPGPFEPQFAYHGPSHSVARSMHFALQWFALQHPEYEYLWNWEMDVRYTGHYYELFDRLTSWAKQQPRKGIWERSARFFIPAYHRSWGNFSDIAGSQAQDGEDPVWGPIKFSSSNQVLDRDRDPKPPTSYATDNYIWGVGEEADYISLMPLFDPNGTLWTYRNDVSGYNTSLPIPPRRSAIITAGRLSRRLLLKMHEETYIAKHSMQPEMWPPSCALLHGFKAVFAPHPVYFDRAWPPEHLNRIFNGGRYNTSGGNEFSVFGYREDNLRGTSWYYNSGFAGALWRRWLGYQENNEGGVKEELKMGRMCLRSTLMHPIKLEFGPFE